MAFAEVWSVAYDKASSQLQQKQWAHQSVEHKIQEESLEQAGMQHLMKNMRN